MFKRFLGAEVQTEPDVNSEDIEMDRLFNRTKEVVGMEVESSPPIDEFTEVGIASKIFPTLFIDRYGDPTDLSHQIISCRPQDTDL